MRNDVVRVYEFRFNELIESEKRCEKLEQAFEKMRAEIYEEFMTIDGEVHDESAIKCMQIIDKYRNEVM